MKFAQVLFLTATLLFTVQIQIVQCLQAVNCDQSEVVLGGTSSERMLNQSRSSTFGNMFMLIIGKC